jgi:hypothetical protein
MPITPNDPEYSEIMRRHREECHKAKKLYGHNRICKKDLLSLTEKEILERERESARRRKRAQREKEKRALTKRKRGRPKKTK